MKSRRLKSQYSAATQFRGCLQIGIIETKVIKKPVKCYWLDYNRFQTLHHTKKGVSTGTGTYTVVALVDLEILHSTYNIGVSSPFPMFVRHWITGSRWTARDARGPMSMALRSQSRHHLPQILLDPVYLRVHPPEDDESSIR
ncbi:hypothetical protein Tco_1058661 [Tanacetum coccineum]|uniref:Uncharacterized protein n=1 Tax=Tanacetum coccineum TaxID=301880 RepID=A0ABQ5H9Q8_9ASTR